MRDFIRQGVNAEHKGEGAGVMQVLRDQVFAQGQAIQVAGHGANQEAHHQGLAEDVQRVAEDIALAPGHNALKHQDREQGTDRIDDDAFPAQDIGQVGFWPDRAQQRRDHRGAGNDGNGAEQQCYRPGHIQQPAY